MPTPLPDPELARIIGKVRTLSERCQEREAACARAKQVALRPSSARRDPFEFAGLRPARAKVCRDPCRQARSELVRCLEGLRQPLSPVERSLQGSDRCLKCWV